MFLFQDRWCKLLRAYKLVSTCDYCSHNTLKSTMPVAGGSTLRVSSDFGRETFLLGRLKPGRSAGLASDAGCHWACRLSSSCRQWTLRHGWWGCRSRGPRQPRRQRGRGVTCCWGRWCWRCLPLVLPRSVLSCSSCGGWLCRLLPLPSSTFTSSPRYCPDRACRALTHRGRLDVCRSSSCSRSPSTFV